MDDNKRAHFRVKVDEENDVYLTIGLTGQVKHDVLDLSEGGVCFLSKRKLVVGENTQIRLHFPWLKDSIEVNVRPVRCKKIDKEGGDDEGGENDEESSATYGIGSRFAALTIGQEDKLYSQVRKLERMHISEQE